MSMNTPVARRAHSGRDLVSAPGSTNLADLLERVLDKGVVVAGDIVLALGAVEFLTLKIRLLIASIDKARELGIDWWESDRFVSSRARERELEEESDLLKRRLDHLERLLLAPPQEADKEHAEAGQGSNAAPAYVLDKQGRVIAELKQPVEQAQEEERPQTQERAPQPAEQPQEEERSDTPERAAQPEAAQKPAPARVLEEEGRMSAKPKQGRVKWRLAAVDLDREGRVIAERKQPAQQSQEEEQDAAPAYILDKQGRVIAELKQPGQQPREEEQPQTQERAPQPAEQSREEDRSHPPERAPHLGAVQAEQPAEAGPLLGPALHAHLAQAMRPVLEELRQRNAQARSQRWHEEEQPQKQEQLQAPQPEAAQNAAPARVLVKQGRAVAELTQPAEQPQEEERSHTPERAAQAGAAQAEQPAEAGPLLGPALHAHLAQAIRPVLEELRQRKAQAPQPGEQPRPVGRHDEEQPPEEEQPQVQKRAPQPEAAQTPAPAFILAKTGRLIAELKPPLEQAQEDAGLQAPERAPQPEATQAEQPAGAGPLLGPALHAHLAQAIRPVLEELRQRKAQAPQPGEQPRPVGRHDEEQ